MRQNKSLSAVILFEPTVIYLPFLLSDRSQLSIDIFPLIPIGSLEQILDENWFPEYNGNHYAKAD